MSPEAPPLQPTAPITPLPPASSMPESGAGCLPVVGLIAFGVTWLLPLALLGWAVAFGLSCKVAGRVLANADAFSHRRFDYGFVWGVIALALGLFGVVWDWVAAKKGEENDAPMSLALAWLPLGFGALFGSGAWLWQTVLDRPLDDAGFAAAATLVMAAGCIGSVPLAFRVAWLPCAWLWQLAKKSGVAAGFVGGATLVAAAGAGLVEYQALPTLEQEIAEARTTGVDHPAGGFGRGNQAAEFALQLAYAAHHEGESPPVAQTETPRALGSGKVRPAIPAFGLPDTRDLTNDCLAALGSDCADKPCPVEREKLQLRARLIQPTDIEDIVHATLLEVCLRAQRGQGPDDWRGALHWRVSKRTTDYHRYRGRWNACEVDDLLDAITPLPVPVETEVDHEHLHAALCRLSLQDQCVLRARYFDGMDEILVAAKCHLSYAAARKQLERARKRLRERLDSVGPFSREGEE